MRERQRQHEDEQREQPVGGAPSGDDALAALGGEAERLLAAGDAAIERALSADSEAFLRATRQHGGE